MKRKKPAFIHVLELDNGMVHLEPPPGMDQVTLCGLTDWFKSKGGKPTRGVVTCQPCRWIADYCQAHRPIPKVKRK